MLHTFLALLKFNLFSLFITAIWIGYLDYNHIYHPSGIYEILMVMGAIFWIMWNIRIVVVNRKRIVHSLIDGSIDVAATALDFKDAARARVEERRNKR